MSKGTKYHIGFGRDDLGDDPPTAALICGDPDRTRRLVESTEMLRLEKQLSKRRGLRSYLVSLPGGRKLLAATHGMGAPCLSIVVNELFDVGIRQFIRVGTSGSIQEHVKVGSVVVTRAALCRQGAANDIAPVEYPSAANPFLTVALVEAAKQLGIDWHIGVTASVDTFYEGQERIESSANKRLLRSICGISVNREALKAAGIPEGLLEGLRAELSLGGITAEYRRLNVLNYEMETGTLLKMAGVYGFAAACVCAVVADRTTCEEVVEALKIKAEDDAVRVALRALEIIDPEYMQARYWF